MRITRPGFTRMMSSFLIRRWAPGATRVRVSRLGGRRLPGGTRRHAERGGRAERERSAEQQRGLRRNAIPHLTREDRSGQQADARDEVIDAERAPAAFGADGARDQGALAPFGERRYQ